LINEGLNYWRRIATTEIMQGFTVECREDERQERDERIGRMGFVLCCGYAKLSSAKVRLSQAGKLKASLGPFKSVRDP
jgi:hypothetical protein